MAQNKTPRFGALKAAKPATAAPEPPPEPAPAELRTAVKADGRIQTSVRLDPAIWRALSDLAARLRIETGTRTTVNDLLTDGAKHVLAVHDVKVSE